jgi:hypothetical protein
MAERPILFSAPMVRAILSGEKTQTRRVVKRASDHPDAEAHMIRGEAHFGIRGPGTFHFTHGEEGDLPAIRCPYGKPGDHLWVRETWGMNHYQFEHGPIPKSRPADFDEPDSQYLVFRATEDDAEVQNELRWWPSIHMPRWASRIALEITGVRVERLNECSEQDAQAEGAVYGYGEGAKISQRRMYQLLWDTINGPGAWNANPFVWVVEFKRVQE